MPSRSRACALTLAQLAMPPSVGVEVEHAGRWRRCGRRRRARTRAGTPGARDARCRSGSGRRTTSSCSCARAMSSALSSTPGVRGLSPTMPSGPGWLVARVRTMKRWSGGGGSPGRPPCRPTPSAPTISGSSGLQRDEHRAAVALGDEVEAVVEELAEQREPRVVRRGEALVRRPVRDEELVRRLRVAVVIDRASRRRSRCRGLTAAGLFAVWSTIRLLTARGSSPATMPRFCVVGRRVADLRRARARPGRT